MGVCARCLEMQRLSEASAGPNRALGRLLRVSFGWLGGRCVLGGLYLESPLGLGHHSPLQLGRPGCTPGLHLPSPRASPSFAVQQDARGKPPIGLHSAPPHRLPVPAAAACHHHRPSFTPQQQRPRPACLQATAATSPPPHRALGHGPLTNPVTAPALPL